MVFTTGTGIILTVASLVAVNPGRFALRTSHRQFSPHVDYHWSVLTVGTIAQNYSGGVPGVSKEVFIEERACRVVVRVPVGRVKSASAVHTEEKVCVLARVVTLKF